MMPAYVKLFKNFLMPLFNTFMLILALIYKM